MNRSIKGKFLPCCCCCFFFSCFSAWNLVCTTVTQVTMRWLTKFVNKVGSTVLYRNCFCLFAFKCMLGVFAKTNRPGSFTIFHCRMSTIQPTRVGCTTSKCWYMCCWHLCSCSSYKTIPSFRELFVTQLWTVRCFVTFLSIGFTQVFIMITRIRYKVIL